MQLSGPSAVQPLHALSQFMQVCDPGLLTQKLFSLQAVLLVKHSSMSLQPNSVSINHPSLQAKQPFGPAWVHASLQERWHAEHNTFFVVSIRIVKSTSALLTKLAGIRGITDTLSIAFSGS